MLNLIRECWSARGVLYAQATADLRSSVIDTRLGYVWWLLDPLLLMAVYYFVVQGVFGRGGENYAYFVFAGLVAWRWFTRSISMSVTAYTRNKGLILSIPAPLPVYVLSPILVNAVFALIGLLCVVLVFDASLLRHLPLVLVVMAVQLVLTFAIGLSMAAMTVFVRDIVRVTEYTLRVLFYASPVIYASGWVTASETVPGWVKLMFSLNPFAYLLPAYRALVLNDAPFPADGILVVFLGSLLLLQCSSWLTSRLRNQIPQSL